MTKAQDYDSYVRRCIEEYGQHGGGGLCLDLGTLDTVPEVIWSFADLEELQLCNAPITSLEGIERLPRLRTLNIYNTRVRDLGPLAGVPTLEELTIFLTDVRDLGPLAQLPRLRMLDLSDTYVTDLRPLAGIESLEVIYCYHDSLVYCAELGAGAAHVVDVSPLSALPNLQMVNACGISVLGTTALDASVLQVSQGVPEARAADIARELRKVIEFFDAHPLPDGDLAPDELEAAALDALESEEHDSSRTDECCTDLAQYADGLEARVPVNVSNAVAACSELLGALDRSAASAAWVEKALWNARAFALEGAGQRWGAWVEWDNSDYLVSMVLGNFGNAQKALDYANRRHILRLAQGEFRLEEDFAAGTMVPRRVHPSELVVRRLRADSEHRERGWVEQSDLEVVPVSDLQHVTSSGFGASACGPVLLCDAVSAGVRPSRAEPSQEDRRS